MVHWLTAVLRHKPAPFTYICVWYHCYILTAAVQCCGTVIILNSLLKYKEPDPTICRICFASISTDFRWPALPNEWNTTTAMGGDIHIFYSSERSFRHLPCKLFSVVRYCVWTKILEIIPEQ